MAIRKFSDLIQQDLPPLESWIEPKVLPKRGIWILGGLTGIGKSYITLDIVRALTTATNPWDCPHLTTPAPCRVLYVEQEIGEYGLQERARRVFERHQPRTYDERAFFSSQDPAFQLDTPEGRKHICEEIRECRPNVLILDPISDFHTSEESDNTAISKLFLTIKELKTASLDDDMSVIVLHHFKKPPNGKVASQGYDDLCEDNFRGAGKWTASPDTVTTMAKKGGNKVWWNLQLRWNKMRHGKELDDMLLRVEPEAPFTQVTFEKMVGDAPKLQPIGKGKKTQI